MSTNSREEDVYMEEEEGEPEYEVESILEKKRVGNKWKYRIKWVGYPLDQCTWEPEENLSNVQEMLEEFESEWARKNKEVKKPALMQKSRPMPQVKAPLKETKLNSGPRREEDEDEEFFDSKPSKKRRIDEEEEKPQLTYSLKTSQASQGKKKKENENYKSAVINNSARPLTEMLKSKEKRVGNADAIVLAQEESPKIFGSFEGDDLPKRLVTAKLVTETNEVNCLVEWDARKSGIKPCDTFVSNRILRVRCPQLLLDFYESRLRFPTGK